MNISNTIKRLDPNGFDDASRHMSDLGYINYSRKITIFVKEKENLYKIQGNNIITNVGCLITNMCTYKKDKSIYYNKTVYLCDLEYPSTLKSSDIKKTLGNCLNECTARPLYAFANNVIEQDSKTSFDLGLTLVDLSVCDNGAYGIINFIDPERFKGYEEVVYGNKYNPMFYGNSNEESDRSRIHTIEDLVDNKTKIIFNKSNQESVVNIKNNITQKGIIIDKYTMSLNEYMSSFFAGYLFVPIEKIEFVYDSRLNQPLNIIKLTTFDKFHNDITNDNVVDDVMDLINEKIQILRNELSSDFYIVTRISDQFMICDLHVFNASREIILSKPLYRQYCEYAIDSQQIIDDVEYSGEIAKIDYIEKSIEQIGFNRNISGAIELINNATEKLQMLMSENKDYLYNMIDGPIKPKLIEGTGCEEKNR